MRVVLSNQLHDIESLERLIYANSKFIEHLEKVFSSSDFKAHESFINLPFYKYQIIELLELRKKYNLNKIKKIYTIGIGGSISGTEAVYDLIKKGNNLIEIQFIDQINIEILDKTIKQIRGMERDEYIIFLVSKSGSTLETIYNFEILQSYIDINPERVVVITDEKNPYIIQFKMKGYQILEIPKKIVGRYSVFTSVGLAPLAFAGVNIVKLLEGAGNEIRDLIEGNSTATKSAASKFLSESKVNEILYPSKRFVSLGKWEKQLFNESLGKKNNLIFTSHGNFYQEVHSSLQYYLNSPEIFLNILSFEDEESLLLKEINFLPKNYINTDLNEINKAIELSVKKDFNSRNISFINYEFSNLTELEIGKYMQNKMIEVMFLGLFHKINPFTQPDVQSHKENISRYLS